MKQAIYNRQGRQIINTGYKKFDNATNCISTGNIISNTQYGCFIRPYSKLFFNGNRFEAGHLMKCDMKGFKNVSRKILDIIEDKERKDNVILYQFDVKGDIIGHILCTSSDHYIAHDACCDYNRFNQKKSDCIYTLIDYVSYPNTTEIPDVVKENLVNQILTSKIKQEKLHVAKCTYGKRKYVLHYSMLDTDYHEFPVPRYRLYSPMYVAIYEISDEISKFTYSPKEIHIDNVDVDWFKEA
jgi:hypothetical protein